MAYSMCDITKISHVTKKEYGNSTSKRILYSLFQSLSKETNQIFVAILTFKIKVASKR